MMMLMINSNRIQNYSSNSNQCLLSTRNKLDFERINSYNNSSILCLFCVSNYINEIQKFKGGLISRGAGGLITGIFFCLLMDVPMSEEGAYKRGS